ncbi:MAG TPA: hypothetical protein VIS07_14715 [Candidatus Binatia bacterium]
MIRQALRPWSRTTMLPEEFLDWQVRLRRWTMEERNGSPHVGVAPLLLVRRPGVGPGASAHAIVCGLLPAEDQLEKKTAEFRAIYEGAAAEGARAIYDRGIAYMRDYYTSTEGFDPTSITTLLPRDSAAVVALRADFRCALVFHVFDMDDKSELSRLRCQQFNCRAEIHESGPVYENVWWHNALFHGKVEDHVVVRFRHQSSYDTLFGGLEALR